MDTLKSGLSGIHVGCVWVGYQNYVVGWVTTLERWYVVPPYQFFDSCSNIMSTPSHLLSYTFLVIKKITFSTTPNKLNAAGYLLF
jgi:hypothetical protein